MVSAWPVAGKKKSVDICRAFLAGAGQQRGEASVFYGVDDSNQRDWERARERGDWIYIDNSYFDSTRGTHFRVTKNALQHTGLGPTTGDRLRRLGIRPQPWRRAGNHIVVCPQSADFMRRIAQYPGDWLADTREALKRSTVRPLRVREWDRDKAALSATLAADLRGAWALVTYSSAAAITALINGVPSISRAGAAAYMGNSLSEIERPQLREDRERFLGVLADNQFTLAEMAEGRAWRAINGP